ncbi:hypothetical protein D3C75_897750 [compost metagenome]
MDRRRHFIHRDCDFGGSISLRLHTPRGLLYQLGDIFHGLAVLTGAGGQLFTGSRQMPGSVGDILHHCAERLHHDVIIPGKLADLILAAGLDGFIQLAFTYPLG